MSSSCGSAHAVDLKVDKIVIAAARAKASAPGSLGTWSCICRREA